MARWGRWRSSGALIAVAVVALASLACSSDTTHTGACPPELVEEAACFLAINVTMAETVRQWRSETALACANIARDLGETPPDVGDDVSPDELSDVCNMAISAIAAARAADPSLAIDVEYGECAVDDSAEAACAEDHPEREVCRNACMTEALVATPCGPTRVTVTSSDPAVAATLEANLPALVRTDYQAEIIVEVSVYINDAFVEFAGCADFEEGVRLLGEWIGGVEALYSVWVALLGSIN